MDKNLKLMGPHQRPAPRQLITVLHADVKGYSRLTEIDEDGTHGALTRWLDKTAAAVKTHGGTVVHFAGDAVLASFNTTTSALGCALEIQSAIRKPPPSEAIGSLEFRVGIHLGDVITDRGEIYGNNVNLAVRLQELAPANGICVSGAVFDVLPDSQARRFEHVGDRKVKNINKPIRVYSLRKSSLSHTHSRRQLWPRPITSVAGILIATTLVVATVIANDLAENRAIDKVSKEASQPINPYHWYHIVGVKRLESVNKLKDESRLAQAVTNELTSELARVGHRTIILDEELQPAPRNSSPTPIETTRLIFTGSIQLHGHLVGLVARLVDRETGLQVWSRAYDEPIKDSFLYQRKLAKRVVADMSAALAAVESRIASAQQSDLTL